MQNRHLADSQACGVPGSQPVRAVLFLCVFPAADPSNLLYSSGHVRAHTHVYNVCYVHIWMVAPHYFHFHSHSRSRSRSRSRPRSRSGVSMQREREAGE